MPGGDDHIDADVSTVPLSEYSAGVHARHRRASGRRRLLFFSLSAVWGFIAGAAGVLAGMSATGNTVLREGTIVGLVPALIIAVLGGLVVERAYRESRQRGH